jgi:hypothetical protein
MDVHSVFSAFVCRPPSLLSPDRVSAFEVDDVIYNDVSLSSLNVHRRQFSMLMSE